VFNGCATAGTAVATAARAIETGEHDLTIAIGMDKHPRGAFAADPSVAGIPAWYGQTGLFLTTHFFGMKITRYMHDHGISHRTLARVAAKNFGNAAGNDTHSKRNKGIDKQRKCITLMCAEYSCSEIPVIPVQFSSCTIVITRFAHYGFTRWG
jgi:acetyl-CoA acetyltransferase